MGSPPAKRAFARLVASAVTVPGPEIARRGAAARAARAYIVRGPRVGGGTLYCSLLYFGPDGALLGVHRKLMPTYQERMLWGALSE